ncbi:hypothetical protein ZTR_09178 [Talaromyces verruculosus]|nr:hypothetical protein ZTR_09178 [Talaromyces verruculosus]
MDSKNVSRTSEDDLFSDQDNVLDGEIEPDEAPPAYDAVSTEDLRLSPTYSDEKRQSIFLEEGAGGFDLGAQNYLSYLLVQESLGHEICRVIDHFRRFTLRLPKLPPVQGAGILGQFKIPHTYLWSQSLLPKPDDWDDFIDISGYVTTNNKAAFTPSEDLSRILESAENPVLVLLDIAQLKTPDEFLKNLKEASLKYRIHILLDNKFKNFRSVLDIPTMFVLDSVPLEWLVPKVSVLFTSGQFSSINLALKFGKPMVTLPLLRYQPFWSTAIYYAGLGSVPILEVDFFGEKFVEAFRYCMQQDVRESAQKLSENTKLEDGTSNAVNSFYRHLQLNMFKPSPVGIDSPPQQLQLKPLGDSSVESAVQSGKAGMSETDCPPYAWQGTATNSIAKVKPTFLVEVKGVSRNLMKAIVKPTVSHIADAYNKFENDPMAPKGIQKSDLSKADVAMKVAKNVGFGSAVACGKIALLPFKTVYYMSETASYGVRALKGSDQHESRSHLTPDRISYQRSSQDLSGMTENDTEKHIYFPSQRDDAYTRALSASSFTRF